MKNSELENILTNALNKLAAQDEKTHQQSEPKKAQQLDMLHLMSIYELNDLVRQCKQMIDLKGGLAKTFKIGDQVTCGHPKVSGIVGTIEKVNTKKCKIDFNGEIYNVPMSMIEKI